VASTSPASVRSWSSSLDQPGAMIGPSPGERAGRSTSAFESVSRRSSSGSRRLATSWRRPWSALRPPAVLPGRAGSVARRRQVRERVAQRGQVAGAGPARGRPAGEPLQVVDRGQGRRQRLERRGRLDQRLDGVVAARDRLDPPERRQEPLAQEAAPHGRARPVERAEEGRPPARPPGDAEADGASRRPLTSSRQRAVAASRARCSSGRHSSTPRPKRSSFSTNPGFFCPTYHSAAWAAGT
jgi:hypothetical protein